MTGTAKGDTFVTDGFHAREISCALAIISDHARGCHTPRLKDSNGGRMNASALDVGMYWSEIALDNNLISALFQLEATGWTSRLLEYHPADAVGPQ